MPPPDDRDDDRTGDRSGDRGADRPRRDYRDDPPPKKGKGLLITLAVVGGILLVCVGGCGIFAFTLGRQAKEVRDLADGFLPKVGAGDAAGAYAMMSPKYKAAHTQQQFDDQMKASGLTDFQSVAWGSQSSSTNNGTGTATLGGTATLKSGRTVPVELTLAFDGKTWAVDDVTVTGGGTGGASAAPSAKATPAVSPAKTDDPDDK